MKKIILVALMLIFVSCSDSKKIIASDEYSVNDMDMVDEVDDVDTGDSGDSGDTGDSGNTGNTGSDKDGVDDVDLVDTDSNVDDETQDETQDETADEIVDEAQDEMPDFDTVGMCQEHDECGETQLCLKSNGECNGWGECEDKPVGCAEIYAPVCGCDDKTYTNECNANGAGVNVNYEGECKSTVTYLYSDSGMPPIVLEGELVINEGGSKKTLDVPQVVNRTKSTIEVSFEDGSMGPTANTVVFTFWLSEFPNQICTEADPCKIPFGKGNSTAQWEVGGGTGGGYLNGELTGTVYVIENTDEPMNNTFKFYSEELVFQPFG